MVWPTQGRAAFDEKAGPVRLQHRAKLVHVEKPLHGAELQNALTLHLPQEGLWLQGSTTQAVKGEAFPPEPSSSFKA